MRRLARVDSRAQRVDAARELGVWERANAAVICRCASALAQGGCASPPQSRLIIAHRHHWLLGQLTARGQQHGSEVVTATSNGADALGAIIAEQPDITVLGDTLETITGWEVLAEARVLAPSTAPIAVVGSDDPGA